jgi:multidrug efflux pump
MSIKDITDKSIKDFKLTSFALRNRTTMFLLTAVLVVFGVISYFSMPKELFPEVNVPWIMVQTVYPGNSPVDIENLVTRVIEKEVETVKGIKKITSNSSQDISFIFVEFNFGINIKDALREVKDAVDKAKSDLPDDLPSEPAVMDLDLSEFPIVTINLSGDFSIDELKYFAELLDDEFKGIPEVSKSFILGVNDKEIKIDVNLVMLEANNLSFGDIEGAVASENLTVSGGDLVIGGTRRSVRTVGEFKSIEEIRNIIVKHEDNDIVYLRDIADVYEGYADASSYARLDGQPVVSLQVVKKGGYNILSAIEKINGALAELQERSILPADLKVTVTNDQSEMIQKQLDNLFNSIIISIIFVVFVLYFFLGTRNALFVGMSIPLSMLLSFVVLEAIGYRINMMTLYALILALGMLVDNAIVVVENIYRFMTEGYSKREASRLAVGEVAVPIIASTATTLAAFIKLAFWDSLMGEFMKYLPVTLIVVLTSSLLVSLVIIPVFTASFIKKDAQNEKPQPKRSIIIASVLASLAIIGYASGIYGFANLMALACVLTIGNLVIFNAISRRFQNVTLAKLENIYSRVLDFSLQARNSAALFAGSIVLMVLTIWFYAASNPEVEFFPSADPNYINLMAEMHVGSDIGATDKFMRQLEERVKELIAPDSAIIKSVVTNVGSGAKLENEMGGGASLNPHKGLITISFVDYELRGGRSTADIMRGLSDELIGQYAGVQMIIQKDDQGPPTGKPVNIEVTGPDFDRLAQVADDMINYINRSGISGIEGLKMDLDLGKPEMIISIDRERARRFGLSTGQIASTIRTALFGKEISSYKIGEDKYPIQLRLRDDQRNSVQDLMNQSITFRNNQGKLLSIPISSVADVSYNTTYNQINRKDLTRVITVWSNVIEGYNANEVNTKIADAMEQYRMPDDYSYKFTGEQEEQMEAGMFLMGAMLFAIMLIMVILVSQFNSFVKPLIIIMSVLLSTIGVFGGLATFNMTFVVVMTGIGIVSLAGVVVNNAIVLIDYIDQLKARRRQELLIGTEDLLPFDDLLECITTAGKTRLRPVLLTAITTILGLLPMALGINIDFYSMFTQFDPKFSIGGDMAAMWAPMSWTIIFGLAFATFLTLIIVPVMYRIANKVKYPASINTAGL